MATLKDIQGGLAKVREDIATEAQEVSASIAELIKEVQGLKTQLENGNLISQADLDGLMESVTEIDGSVKAIYMPPVPDAPTIGTATGGDGEASVSFTAPAITGGKITNYTAVSDPGGLTGTGTSSPVTVAGLTNGTGYTFTVTATNASGTGAASLPSNSVTPAAPAGSFTKEKTTR